MIEIPSTFADMMIGVLADFDILDGDIALFAGWVATESAFNPWAIRYEPAFFSRYVKPLTGNLSATERNARATSWGLLQMMGQVARENGFSATYLSSLCEPLINLELGAKILKNRFAATGSWDGALASYNGGLGGNRRAPFRNQYYVDKVRSRALDFRGGTE